MTLQWNRKCRLRIQISGGSEEALDLSDFKIVFTVGQPNVDTPKYAEFFIYNLSAETMNLLAGVDNLNTDTQVVFEVGYGDEALSILFKGSVFQYRRGRDNPTDTWLCVLALSSDKVASYQTVNLAIPAGTSINDMKEKLLEGFKAAGVALGIRPELSEQKRIRGRAVFGSLHENMLQFAKENNCVVSLADNEITMLNTSKYTNVHDVQILTAKTGMIGMPQLTSEGLKVSCLLNPKIVYMGRIQVDLTNLQTEAYDVQYGQQKIDQVFKNPKLAVGAEGVFVVISVIHRGDSRGNQWLTETVSKSINGVTPKSGIAITGVE